VNLANTKQSKIDEISIFVRLRDLRFFTAVKMEFVVFWVVALCSVVAGYQDGGSTVL
jgi:hypothetical protein